MEVMKEEALAEVAADSVAVDGGGACAPVMVRPVGRRR